MAREYVQPIGDRLKVPPPGLAIETNGEGVPGTMQIQRCYVDNNSPDAFNIAIQECHADALRNVRGANGIPNPIIYTGYSWQRWIDGDGRMMYAIYADYANATEGVTGLDAPALDDARKAYDASLQRPIPNLNVSPPAREKPMAYPVMDPENQSDKIPASASANA